jgi:endonuclease I
MTTNLRFQFFAVLSIFLCLTFSLQAQTPPPSTLSGSALRTWYKQNYFDGKHKTLGYSTARKFMYNNIDNKNNSITCVYSGFVQSWTYGGTGTNPAPINCEHTVPQSFFGEAEPMVSDIHHLFPTYGNWNSTRSNYPFADITDSQTQKWMVSSTSQTSIPTSNINSYSEYANQKFEPREDQKGNTARAIFYFYTMYPTQAGAMSQVADVNVLYQWHLSDPVDAAEIDRNNKIQSYQGDRNPYIDYPNTVATAWGLAPQNPTPVTGTDLFISEYIEGSSNNKAIEIYNPTSSSISLSSYSLQKQANGTGSWGSPLSLSGSLASGQTYTIVYSLAGTTLKNKANLVTTSSALTFNGNDAVALFKNTSLIDIVGVFNSSAIFGADVTLVRKATVTKGRTSYATSEWTSYTRDTFTYTGSHTMTGTAKIAVTNPNDKKEESTIQNTENAFNIYPNPTTQDAKLQLAVIESQNVTVRMFDAQGKEVSFQTIFVNGKIEIDLPTNRLKTGLYIVEITGKDFRFTKRMVKE